MKTSSLLFTRLSLALLLSPVTLLAQEQAQTSASETQRESADAIAAEIKRGVAETYRAAELKAAEVEAAIAKALQAGTLKESTAEYYRNILKRYTTPLGQVTSNPSYFPPRFETSEAMEPINLAWADLQEEVTNGQEERKRLADRLVGAISESLQTAPHTAEKPEDLNDTDKLIDATRALPILPVSRLLQGTSQIDTFRQLVAAMRKALEAKVKGDSDRMLAALQRAPRLPQASFPPGYPRPLERPSFPDNTEALWTEFRTRLTASFVEAVKKAQAEVEKRIVSRRPAAEIEEAINTLDAAVAKTSYTNLEAGNRKSLVYEYQNTLATMRALEQGESDLGRLQESSRRSNSEHNVGAEYRQFVSGLQAEVQKKQQVLQAKIEEERRAAAEAQQKQRQEEEAKRIAQEQKEARVTFSAAVEKARQRIAAIRTPKEALTAADELPALLPPPPTSSRYPSEISEGATAWRQAEQELRQIGTAWSDDSTDLPPALSSAAHDRGSGPFLVELRALRDRAARDSFSRRFGAPELNQAPLTEVNTRAAMEKLADNAAAKGDWQRCLVLLQAVAPRTDFSGLSGSERIQAIRSYLSALNYEQAGLYREALSAYRTVLQQTAAGIPLKDAAERVKKLRESHPEAFATAVPAVGINAVPSGIR